MYGEQRERLFKRMLRGAKDNAIRAHEEFSPIFSSERTPFDLATAC